MFKTNLQEEYDLHWSHNPRAKRLSLRVDHKAGVIRLTVPPRANDRSIRRFLDMNRDWIKQRQATLLPKIEIENGALFPFLGKQYNIQIRHHNKRTTDIIVIDEIIYIYTSREDPTTNFKRWVIDQARQHIEPLAHNKAAEIKKTISKIDLRDTATRWGSCSTDKRLMLCWRLIMAPPYVLDYVVGHEVAHLKRMDHSKKFWNICYSLSEEPDRARRWLKEYGNTLMQYF